jgi:hypothetical protein
MATAVSQKSFFRSDGRQHPVSTLISIKIDRLSFGSEARVALSGHGEAHRAHDSAGATFKITAIQHGIEHPGCLKHADLLLWPGPMIADARRGGCESIAAFVRREHLAPRPRGGSSRPAYQQKETPSQ